MRGLSLPLSLALCLAPSVAVAQTAADPPRVAVEVAVDEDTADRRQTGEALALALTAGSYALRSGTMIEWLIGRRANDGEPETFWILPGALALGGATGALLIDHARPLRRGRGLTAGSSMLIGYIGSLTIAMQLNGEAIPSAVSLTGPATWVGSTAGLATGILVGHLTDARPGQALFVGTGAVGGTLLGTFLCGALRCRGDLGAWALTGEVAGLVATLSTVTAFSPSARDMRLTAVGGVAGLFPAGAVLSAYLARDGGITEDAWAIVSGTALGGLVVGGVTGYAIARSTRPSRASGLSVTVTPTFGGTAGRYVGLTAYGEL